MFRHGRASTWGLYKVGDACGAHSLEFKLSINLSFFIKRGLVLQIFREMDAVFAQN